MAETKDTGAPAPGQESKPAETAAPAAQVEAQPSTSSPPAMSSPRSTYQFGLGLDPEDELDELDDEIDEHEHSRRVARMQAELQRTLLQIHERSRQGETRGRPRLYRLEVTRTFPHDAACELPAIELQRNRAGVPIVDLEEIPRRYGGGRYTAQLARGRKRYRSGRLEGLAFAGEPYGVPGIGPSPWGPKPAWAQRQEAAQAQAQGQEAEVGPAFDRAVSAIADLVERSEARTAAILEKVVDAQQRGDTLTETIKALEALKRLKTIGDELAPEPAAPAPPESSDLAGLAALVSTLAPIVGPYVPQLLSALQSRQAPTQGPAPAPAPASTGSGPGIHVRPVRIAGSGDDQK